MNTFSDFSFKDVLSIATTGFPTKAIEKVTGTGTTANKLVSLATTGNPNAISGKKPDAPATPAVVDTSEIDSKTAEIQNQLKVASDASAQVEKEKRTQNAIIIIVALILVGVLLFTRKSNA